MRFFTAGESHGPELTAIIEGLPAGLALSLDDINQELARRQKGYGRGGRMSIEKDTVRITSGLRHGRTLGSPLTLVVENKDYGNWESVMSTEAVSERELLMRRVIKPRPGHADLVGGMKYRFTDLRNVLERSSARETTMRVAIGAVAKKLLIELEIPIASHVVEIGGIKATGNPNLSMNEIQRKSENSLVRCLNDVASKQMMCAIDNSKKEGDTLGGVVEVIVENVPAGLGSYTQWDRKLDGKISQALMSINAFKGVSFGVGFDAASLPGSQVMDEIHWEKEVGFSRNTNHLGGFEGGMTNGMPIIVRGVMKPIPTLYKPLSSVNIETKEIYKASVERSDTCAVPAAAVIAENVVATTLAQEIMATFHADSFECLKEELKKYRDYLINY